MSVCETPIGIVDAPVANGSDARSLIDVSDRGKLIGNIIEIQMGSSLENQRGNMIDRQRGIIIETQRPRRWQTLKTTAAEP
ncbi:hypothetical protein N9L68_08755 [bacterium]|nr:hypothetical protein [bacterium]